MTLETIVIAKAINNVGTITVLRPRVSAKKPQKCDEKMIPKNPTPLSTPLSLFDKFRSHCAMGRMKLIETVSRKTHPSMAPVRMIKQ